MNFTKRKALNITFFLLFLSMLALGLAYIWHAVPASAFTGIIPSNSYDTLEGWYAYNEITGWCLSFIAVVNLSFLAFAGRQIKKSTSFIFAVSISLLISVITAAIAAEFLENFIIQ